MSLKAVIFDFNGVIINDESIHQELIDEILLGENLRPSDSEYQQLCLGKSDRRCLQDILNRRGRVVSEDYLTKLIKNKAAAYHQRIQQLETLPIYPGVKEFLAEIQTREILIALVTGALRNEVELVLHRGEIAHYFPVIVTGDQLKVSKPEPDGYLLAVERLNRLNPALGLQPANCLAIEDTPAGIEAAKRAGMQVVGVANTYPFHMLQRQTNWTVDYLAQLEIERVEEVLNRSKNSFIIED